jgi:hypothetical protein
MVPRRVFARKREDVIGRWKWYNEKYYNLQVYSWCRAPSGAHDQIFITLWQLRSCFYGAPSLTRGRVCLLYMLLALASVVFLWSESLGTRDHILRSQIWDFPFRRFLRFAGSRWRYSNPPPHGWLIEAVSESESESNCDWRSVTLSILVSSPVRGSWPDIRYCLTVTVLSLGGAPSLTRGWVCRLSESVSSNKSIVSMYSYIHFTCFTWYDIHIKYIQGLCQSGLSTADYALFLVAFVTTAV